MLAKVQHEVRGKSNDANVNLRLTFEECEKYSDMVVPGSDQLAMAQWATDEITDSMLFTFNEVWEN